MRRFLILIVVPLMAMGAIPVLAATEADTGDWTVTAETPYDIWSNGGGWAIGTEILVLVNDGLSGPEFAKTVTVEQRGPDPSDVGWSVHSNPFEIEDGDLITVYDGADGVVDRHLDVLDLTIDPIDSDLDMITGTAPVGAAVEVDASDGTTNANRSVVAIDGTWTADFSTGDTFDIRPGTWGLAAVFEDDGDAIQRGWQVRVPEIQVDPQNNSIEGFWWEIGATVSVQIDDLTNGSGVDWTDSTIVAAAPWDPSQGYVHFQPGDESFDVLASQVVTMIEGAIVKDLTVAPLTITEVDTDNDLVSGTATPSNLVSVWVSGPTNMRRDVTAASDGTWTADFSVPWDGFDARDIGPGDRVDAKESDVDNDATYAASNVPNPQFSVETPNQIWSQGDGWIAGRTVTITVDADHDLSNGVLYSTTRPVLASGPEAWEVGWNANISGFDILPGHVVAVDDQIDIVRTLDVVKLVVSDVDELNDTISGVAPALSWVSGNADDGFENAGRRVQAGADGTFTIDFGNPGVDGWEQTTVDIRPGVGGSIQVNDNDNDSTHRSWRVTDPYIGVNVIHEEMWAFDWPIGAILSFTVEDPATPESPDWEDTMTVVETNWGQTEAGYRFWGDFDVHAGQVIVVTDGTLTRTLEVSTLVVTNVDPDSDRYDGTVDPTHPHDSVTEVCAWARHLVDPQQSVESCALPDGAGNWLIDFTGIGNLVAGDHSGAWQIDDDGDRTEYAWFVPPWIYVEIGDDTNPLFPDRIHLDQWAFPVTVTNGTDTVVVSDTYDDSWEVIEFDVTPGQTITATGNDGRVKSLFLEELAVTTVTLWNEDPPSTVFGTTTAAYEGQVQVTASADYGWWTERWVTAAAGLFEADFDTGGNGWREQELGDFGEGGADDIITAGGEIRAHIWDADNDQIQTIWHTCNPRIIIVRGNDRIEAVCFPSGAELTIELDDPNFEGIEFSDTGIVDVNPDKPWETLLIFELGDYTVPDEATVTATDDVGTPPIVTEVIAFTVDEIEPDADTLTGTAPAGSEVLVQADGNWRYPIADETNSWVADFSQPGDQPGEENPVDIGPGSSGGATLLADGGSATTVLWRLSAASFGLDPTQNNMWGNEFAPNASVNITVDGSDQGTYPTDAFGQFNAWWDSGGLDFTEGMVVDVTDGDTTKTHTITALVVTDVNDTDDTVSGTAAAGSDVDIWVHDSDAWRHVVADAVTGAWTAAFGVVGDDSGEEGTADLTLGSNGNSGQCDEDGDCTHASWWVANPAIIEVDVDIKPGGYPNSINIKRAKGVVPLAVLGSDDFDVMSVDFTTLRFGPDLAIPAHLGTDDVYLDHLEDVNGDGFMDLVSHYVVGEIGLASGDTEACLVGKTLSGIPIEGCDSVRIIG